MKKKFSICRLHFTSPVHLGDTRDDYSISLKTVSSDTMYAALTSSLAKIGREIPENGDLGFSISSLFPFYQKDLDSEPIYFFPKPLRSSLTQLKEIEKVKAIKKIQWLDEKEFSKILQGDYSSMNSSESEESAASPIKGHYLTNQAVDKDFIFSSGSQRVKVPRDYSIEKDATPFYMDRISFKDYSGLFFIIDGKTNLLKPALDILQFEGIGTDRNIGNGLFSYDICIDEIELDLPDSQNTEYVLSLSMFIPETKKQLTEMLKGDKTGYDFVRRGGWITTHPFNTYRKNAIHAFIHGSVFSHKMPENIEISGRIVNLRPEIELGQGKVDHPIWRNGRSFFIPIVV